MASLAVKYRPKDFNDVCSQKSVIRILENQIATETFHNCMIFSGTSGAGKTTLARIFANKINGGVGEPIEVDAASNNGVDNIRTIVDEATQRSLDSKYKVIILDECHALTNQSWQAFLKCIEEPPKFTVFIFCTTDPQKIPQTIVNRCQVFRITRIPNNEIIDRLKFICNNEGYTIDEVALNQITRAAEGSMRQAITFLDKCKDYSTTITEQSVISCIGNYSYDVYFNLTNAVIDNNKIGVFNIIDELYNSGSDLKVFVSSYFSFVLQLLKYCLLKSIASTDIPSSLEEKVKYTVGIENNVEWFNNYVDKVLAVKQAIKGDTDIKTTIKVMLSN